MNLTVELYAHNAKRIWMETDEVRIFVAELRNMGRRGWELAYLANAGMLKPAATETLVAYCKDQLTLTNITKRMLA